MNSQNAVHPPINPELFQGPKHPWRGSSIGCLRSFDEWLAEWHRAELCEVKLGLLHALTINDRCWRCQETLIFLLVLADGFQDANTFASMMPPHTVHSISMWIEDRDRQLSGMSEAKQMREVARKALAILCDRLFKDGTEDDSRRQRSSWLWMLEDESVFNAVLWFFRTEGQLGNIKIRNTFSSYQAERDRHAGIIHGFLFEFAKLGWERHSDSFHKEYPGGLNDKAKARVLAARPVFIEFLRDLGQLSWLIGKELDGASLKKLDEIVFRKNVYLPQDSFGSTDTYRQPKTLEEAILGGSVAAQVLMLNEVRVREARAFEARYKLSREEHDARQRVKELAKLQQQKAALEEKERELSAKGQ